jgi:hypothetical protein
MSTKTIYKRIALVAVAALGVGVLSVAPANAGSGAITLNAGAAGVATSGVCAAGVPTALATAQVLTVTGKQTVSYAVMASSGTQYTHLIISGPATWSSSASGAISVDGKSISQATELSAGANVLVPTGTGLVRVYLATSLTGTAVTTNYIQVVSACTTSTFDPSKSFVQLETANGTADSNVDEATKFANTETAYLDVVAKNAYNVALASGLWVATATNGALLGIADATTPSCGLTSSVFATALGTDLRIAICQPTSGVALSTTVTLTYNGVTIATRSLVITGDLARIEVTSVAKATEGDQNYKSFKTRTFDAAGNQIAWADASLTVTGVDPTNVSAADAGITIVDDYQWATNTVTCIAAAKGTSTLKVKGLTAALTYVESAPFAVTCSDNVVDTYTASLDKASYVPGDIATLTITAKDSNGNAVADPYDTDSSGATVDTFTYIGGSSTAAPVATGSNMTAVVAPTAGDYTVGGVKTYKFIVGSNEGSYQMTVQMSGVATDVAKTVAYKIAASTTTVSNADVLKAIVSLIASINKQIAALQKALLRR